MAFGIFEKFNSWDWVRFIIAWLPLIIGAYFVLFGKAILDASGFTMEGINLSLSVYGLGFTFLSLGANQMIEINNDVQHRCDWEIVEEIRQDVKELLARIPKLFEIGEAPETTSN